MIKIILKLLPSSLRRGLGWCGLILALTPILPAQTYQVQEYYVDTTIYNPYFPLLTDNENPDSVRVWHEKNVRYSNLGQCETSTEFPYGKTTAINIAAIRVITITEDSVLHYPYYHFLTDSTAEVYTQEYKDGIESDPCH